MKFNRIFLALILGFAMLAATGRDAHAALGVIPIISGSTARVLAGSTNVVVVGTTTNTYGAAGTSTNLALPVNEFDYVGLTWTFSGSTNNTLLIYKSYDNGVTYSTNADFTYANQTAVSGTFVTNAALDVRGATTLAFVQRNTGIFDSTNELLEINLKAPKVLSIPATR